MATGRTWNRRLAVAGSLGLAAGGYLALRPGRERSRQKAQPGTLYRGNIAEPESLDPSLVQGQPEEEILGDLMVGLMDVDAMGRPVPAMAADWKTSPDGLTWTFHLRQALWSDGKPVTAADFVFSWRKLLNPATAAFYAYFAYPIKNGRAINSGKMRPDTLGARALDARTLEITLEHPVPYLLEMLTHMTMNPQPSHAITMTDKSWARPGRYIGNGPFLLKEWVPNGHILLEKNPLFFDAANVSLKQVVYYPTDDYAAAVQRLRAGELDFQDRTPPERIPWIKQNMPGTIQQVPQLIVDFLSINVRRKPFDDVRIRRAINLVISRDAICERVLRGTMVPAYNLVPPKVANYPGGVFLPFQGRPYQELLSEAQGLMQSAGFSADNVLRATVMTRATTPGIYRSVSAALQQMLALIHINVSILPNDMMMFYDTIQVHNYDLAYAGWQGDFDDALTFLELFTTGNGQNWGSYSSPAFDKMMEAAQHDADITSRGQKLAAAERMLLDDHALAPLYFWKSTNLIRPYLKGMVANPLDYHRSRWISIDEAARAKLLT